MEAPHHSVDVLLVALLDRDSPLLRARVATLIGCAAVHRFPLLNKIEQKAGEQRAKFLGKMIGKLI